MKYFFVCCAFLSISPVWALSSITAGPVKSQIGHAGIRLNWTSDTAGFSRWGWDTVSHAGASSSTAYANHYTSNAQHTVHGMYVSGLLASTTYFYRVCAYNGLEVCAAEDSFTTLALPNPHPALPTPPTPVDNTLPTCANGRIEVCSGGNPVPAVVGPNCDDPTTGLVATYNAAAWGTVIQIPVTTICQGAYHFSKSGWDGIGRMVIESANAANLLPGVRVGPQDAPNMANIYESFWHHPGSTNGTQSTCYPSAFEWDDNTSTPGWYMHYCGNSGSPGTISNVTGNSVAFQPVYTVTLSTPVTSVAVGQWGYMTGIGGIPRANGSFQVTAVTSTSSFTVQMYNSYGSTTNPTYTSGGTVQMFDWQDVGFTPYSGAAPTGSCTPGTTDASAWAYSNQTVAGGTLAGNRSIGSYNDKTYSTGRVWRCTAPNVWSPHYIKYSAMQEIPDAQAAVFDLSATTHTWIVGLNFGTQPIFNDPLLYRSGQSLSSGNNAFTQGGSNPGEYIFTQSGTTTDVIIDRCIFTRLWPMKGDLLIQLDGTNMVLQNSYLQSTGVNWWGHEDRGSQYNNAASEIVEAGAANGALVDNNYLEHYGITVHFFDSGMGRGFNGANNNITVSRNTFYRNFALIDQAPGSTVNYYTPLRQLLEFKSGVNVDINGNTFTNNFQNVSQGGAIAIGPEQYGQGGPGIFCSLSYSGSTGTFTVLLGRSYTVNVGDWIWLPNDDSPHMYQVSAVNPGSLQFTVPNLIAGLNANVFVTVLTGGDGISDVNVRNNTFNNLPTVFGNYSHVSHDAQPTRISLDRLQLSNNVFNQLGPGGTGTGILAVPPAEAWQTSGSTGSLLNIWGGAVDYNLVHNTIYSFNRNPDAGANVGSILLFVNNDFPPINVAENEGLVYQNNMEWTSTLTDPVSAFSTSGFNCAGNGNTVLNCFTAGNLPYSITGNATYLPGGNPGGYSAGNFWGNFNGASVPFVRPTLGNFELLATSCCISGGAHPAQDGLDQGANMQTLAIAQGQVSLVRTTGITATSATVSFFAPDGIGCPVDVGTDPGFATYTRVLSAGGTRTQSVALGPLVTKTQYFFRVNCQVQRPTGTFVTR